MSNKLHTEEMDSLLRGILSLESVEECYAFFEDLCTAGELLSLGQRFEVAAMLKKGMTYHDVAEATGASTATISRVSRTINYGNGGYGLVLERIQKKNS